MTHIQNDLITTACALMKAQPNILHIRGHFLVEGIEPSHELARQRNVFLWYGMVSMHLSVTVQMLADELK